MTLFSALSERIGRGDTRRLAPNTKLCYGFWLGIVLLAHGAPAEESDSAAAATQIDTDGVAELRRLEGIWGQWPEKVKSIRIKGFQFFGACPMGSNALLRRDLEGLVLETVVPAIESGARDKPSLDRLTSPIFSNPNRSYDEPRPPTGEWRPYRFVASAGKLRQDLKMLTMDSRVRKDGTEQVYQEGAQQVSLYPTYSNVFMPEIGDFAFAPSIRPREAAWSLQSHDGEGRLASSGSLIDYDPGTAFVHHCVTRSGERWYFLERFQAMPVSTAADVPIAQFIAEVRFWPQESDGSDAPVNWLTMYLLDSIEVNPTVESSEFALAVPAGTNIVQFDSADNNAPPEQGGARPSMRQVQEPVVDAGAVASDPSFGSAPAPQIRMESDESAAQGTSKWTAARIALIGANVVVLAAIIVWATQRGKKRVER